jgi:hypothetical protein
MQLRGLCCIGTLGVRGRDEDKGRPGESQLWKRYSEVERGGEVKKLAVDRGRWKSFAPRQETTANDEDDDDDDDDDDTQNLIYIILLICILLREYN